MTQLFAKLVWPQGPASMPTAQLSKSDVPAKLEITSRVKSTPEGNGKRHAKGSKGSSAKTAPPPPLPKAKPATVSVQTADIQLCRYDMQVVHKVLVLTSLP